MIENNDILLEFAGEGGGIQIQRRYINNKTVFICHTHEHIFSSESKQNETNTFDDFQGALENIFNNYQVHLLHILTVHSDYRNLVIREFEKMLNSKSIKEDDFVSKKNNSEELCVNFNYDRKIKKWKVKKIYKFILEDLTIEINEYSLLFDKIRESKSPIELKKIAYEYNLNLESDKYPRLEFQIKPNEIEELIKNGTLIIDETNKLTINQQHLDPLTRLLFALAWKQGDLQKLKPIIKGIIKTQKPNTEENDSLVFNSFGQHLSNPEKNPIVDQHVVRAVKLFNDLEGIDLTEIRKMDKVNYEDKQKYIEFISNLNCMTKDYLFYVDRILFEVGRIIKLPKK